jgi:hypothetical protein
LLLEADPALALRHAQAARSQAARIASVREAVGLAAYHAGEWRIAVSELRAWTRFTGSDAHLPVIADAERALGRPEKAIALADSPDVRQLDQETRVELLIVAAGAAQDLGDPAAAVERLRIPELRHQEATTWLARLRYAFAEALLAAGAPDEEAREWFLAAAEVDDEHQTDAGDRALDLDGVQFLEQDDEPGATEPATTGLATTRLATTGLATTGPDDEPDDETAPRDVETLNAEHPTGSVEGGE